MVWNPRILPPPAVPPPVLDESGLVWSVFDQDSKGLMAAKDLINAKANDEEHIMMGISYGILIVSIYFLLHTTNAVKIQCASNVTRVSSDLPAKVEFPPVYTAAIRYSYWNKTSALINEQKLSSLWKLKRISRQGTTSFNVGKVNVTFNETWCSTFQNVSTLTDIYGLPNEVVEALHFDGFSISQLVHSILTANFSQKFYATETVVVGGVEAVQWIGCERQIGASDKALQVEVAFAGPNSTAPYSPQVQNPIVLSIHIVLYNETNQSVIHYISFDISEIDVPKPSAIEDELDVPRGVYCNGMENTEIRASLPDKFEASFDYTDVYGKIVHDVDMLYDAEERIITFRMNALADRDAPFIGNVSLPKDFSLVNVIHDFKYGLQYILDGDNNACKEVKGIDADFGDVTLIDVATKEIDMKSPAQIIMNVSKSEFYYGGKRLSEEGAELELYVSRSTPSTEGAYSVVELLFSTQPWLFDSSAAPFLHSVAQYHKNESGMEVGRTVIRLHSFRNASGQTTRWTSVSAYPCLRLVEDSYLYVNLKNSSLTALEKLGLSRVQSALRETLAHTAGISVLRVANFFFKQIQENVVAFFVIGEASGVAPANTKDRLNESSAIEARELLNSTLMERDISFVVIGSDLSKTELKLARTSLGIIPSKWAPSPPSPPSFNGYTGGSMFVLGLFMLLLGVGVGVGGMFFMWKRQRLTGLAYQVFE
ncbi:Uncharacterized protein Y92H12BR.3 [Toxocara canis]|uniref:Uncharacterized protein Y92H12BR.3 n=1 Tax=Toxocara canis TaxID=6265 RepID=A0A0B2W1R7_TOXCA|nr:Uncharacterized protein Y92H12BR.3 [Toxocara canis]